MRLGRLGQAAGLGAVAVAAALLLHCAKDDREDAAVVVVKECPDLGALSEDPTSPFATLRVFVEVAEEIKTKSADAEKRLMAACNEIDTELGLATGTSAVTACQSLSKRMEAVIRTQPPSAPGPNAPPAWVELKFPPSCKRDPGVQAACVAKCAGPCDNTKCDPAKLVGICDGECKGECSTAGVDAPCTGKCQGTCSGLDKTDCAGECVGQCGTPTFQGQCEGGCSYSAAGFAGLCKGLCTGVCDGQPIGIPPQVPDAGDGGDGGDAGDGGAEASAPIGAACPGRCIGYCSSKAYGNCGGTCAGQFSGGGCVGGCTGTCSAGRAGTPCSTTCTGTCTTAAGPSCKGTCRGGCSVPLREPACEGSLNCNQNIECRNACNAKAEAAVTCTPAKDGQVFVAGDDVLYASLKKHGAALGALADEIEALRGAQAFIAERTPSDFSALGANNDLGRACSARGIKANTEALDTIRNLITADPTTRKYAL